MYLSNLCSLFDQLWLTLPRVGVQYTHLSHLHSLFDRLWYASWLPLESTFIQNFYLLFTTYLTHHRLHPTEHISYLSGIWETLKYPAASDSSNGNMALFLPMKPPRPQSCLQLDRSNVMPYRRGPGWRSSYDEGELPRSTCLWSNIYNPKGCKRHGLFYWMVTDRSLDTAMRPLQKQRHAHKILRFWLHPSVLGVTWTQTQIWVV